MIDIKKEIDMSVDIANNFENIDNCAKMIFAKVKDELFKNDSYAEAILEITKHKKMLDSIVLLNRELVKQYCASVINTYSNINKECVNLSLQRDQKDNLNNGRNINASKVLDGEMYYTFEIPETNTDACNYNLSAIKICTNEMHKIGSADTLLHEYLPKLCSDIQYMSQQVSLILQSFLDNPTGCINGINDILETVKSSEVISCINQNNINCDKINEVINKTQSICEFIFTYSKQFQFYITKIVSILTAIKMNLDIQTLACDKYIVCESLL